MARSAKTSPAKRRSARTSSLCEENPRRPSYRQAQRPARSSAYLTVSDNIIRDAQKQRVDPLSIHQNTLVAATTHDPNSHGLSAQSAGLPGCWGKARPSTSLRYRPESRAGPQNGSVLPRIPTNLYQRWANHALQKRPPNRTAPPTGWPGGRAKRHLAYQ